MNGCTEFNQIRQFLRKISIWAIQIEFMLSKQMVLKGVNCLIKGNDLETNKFIEYPKYE